MKMTIKNKDSILFISITPISRNSVITGKYLAQKKFLHPIRQKLKQKSYTAANILSYYEM